MHDESYRLPLRSHPAKIGWNEMKPKFCLAMLGLGLAIGAPPALEAAEVASTTLTVTATVLDSCILTAPAGLVFASVNTGAVTNQSVQGTVTVVCTAAKPSVTVKLEGGDNAVASQRNMKSVANDLLPYIITSDAGHTTAVAIGGNLFSGALTAITPNIFSVYGQIPSGTYPAGIYTDTVRVTLNY